MARSFDELPLVTSAMAKRMDGVATKLVKAAARAAGQKVVETTRVDTGRARSNWRANLNGPAIGVIPPYAPGNKLGIAERANATAAMAQHRVVINSFDVRRHQSIFISNGVRYIGLLNNGGPFISPGNMIEQGVQAAKVAVQSERVLQSLVPRGATGRLRSNA
jgi:hypothetical protein